MIDRCDSAATVRPIVERALTDGQYTAEHCSHSGCAVEHIELLIIVVLCQERDGHMMWVLCTQVLCPSVPLGGDRVS